MVPGKEDLEGQQDTEGRLLFSEQMPKTFPAEQAGPPSDGRLWPAGKKNALIYVQVQAASSGNRPDQGFPVLRAALHSFL